MVSVVAAAGTRVLNRVASGVLLKAEWAQGGCAIIYTNNKILAASFIYGMAFDFIVLCLTAWKLAFPSGGRSRLITLIFGDGLIYFLVACVEHCHPIGTGFDSTTGFWPIYSQPSSWYLTSMPSCPSLATFRQPWCLRCGFPLIAFLSGSLPVRSQRPESSADYIITHLKEPRYLCEFCPCLSVLANDCLEVPLKDRPLPSGAVMVSVRWPSTRRRRVSTFK